MNSAVVLLSGGLDSVVSAAAVKDSFDKIYALTFNYGQRAFIKENEAAVYFSNKFGFAHKTIELPFLNDISSSSLNSSDKLPSPDLNDNNEIEESASSVWVPNRNALFINIAAAYCEITGSGTVIIGANNEEAGTFKDNSKSFIDAVNLSLSQSCNIPVKVIAPIINLDKKDIVKKAVELNIPFDKIFSCYDSTKLHCGKCESCLRLKRALELNGMHDIICNVFNGDK